MKHGIQLPPFGPLADPIVLVEIGIAADEAGWDGIFLWDHVIRRDDRDWEIADPWVALAAIGAVTMQIRIGPMVTPMARRRVVGLARQTVTLDRLTGGRLVLGVGVGSNSTGEFRQLGEETDMRRRAEALDEGLTVLSELWTGKSVTWHGETIRLDDVVLLPTPLQRIPIWVAATSTAQRPLQRAARHDGIVLTDIGAEATRQVLRRLYDLLDDRPDFDIAVPVHPRGMDCDTVERMGATWALHSFWVGHRPDQLLRFIQAGPPQQ